MNEQQARAQLVRMIRVLPKHKVQNIIDTNENGDGTIKWARRTYVLADLLKETKWKLIQDNRVESDDEVVGQPATLIDGEWEATDENGRVISNRQPKQQRMVKPKTPWMPTPDKARNGMQVWMKIVGGKGGKQRRLFGVGPTSNSVRRASKHFIETGTHKTQNKVKVEHVAGSGVSKSAFRLGRRMFLASESKAARRKDRKTTETLVTNPLDYNPKTNDMIGVDDANYRLHDRHYGSSKKGPNGYRAQPVVSRGQYNALVRGRAKRALNTGKITQAQYDKIIDDHSGRAPAAAMAVDRPLPPIPAVLMERRGAKRGFEAEINAGNFGGRRLDAPKRARKQKLSARINDDGF